MRFKFPGKARLRSEREFKEVYRLGRRLRIFPLRFCALRRPEGRSRLGLAVGRKVGGAVVRNRWKRAIREAFRLNRHLLEAPHDIVVSVSFGASARDTRRAADAFLRAIQILNDGESGGGRR